MALVDKAARKKYHNEYMRRYYAIPKNAEKVRARENANKKRLRVAALAYLGNKCKHCGFSDSRALQIDHIFGGGAQEARRIGNHGIERNVVNGVPGYQLLCANCNWIKRAENGE